MCVCVSVCEPYLDAELVVCGSVVELPARDDGEDVTVLQIGQQLQVSGLLFTCREAEGTTCQQQHTVKNYRP